MSSCPSLLLSTYKTHSHLVLKPQLKDFDLDVVRLPKFPVPSSTLSSQHRCHPDRLHTVAAPSTRTSPPCRPTPPPLLGPCRSLPDCLQHCHCHTQEPRRVHVAQPSPPRLRTASSSRPLPSPGPRHPAVTVDPGTTLSSWPSPPPGPHRPTITSTQSTPLRPLPPVTVQQTLSLYKFCFAVFGCLPI
jgi:hypothetical protein